jgi:tRNA G18 (ribose-2'-O)-methylase SpoU
MMKRMKNLKNNKSIKFINISVPEIIYGRNCCKAVLKSDFRDIENVYVLSNYKGTLIN